MSGNIPIVIEYMTRSNEQSLSAIKVERYGSMIKRTEYVRPYDNVLEKYTNESTKDNFIQLEKQWENLKKQE